NTAVGIGNGHAVELANRDMRAGSTQDVNSRDGQVRTMKSDLRGYTPIAQTHTQYGGARWNKGCDVTRQHFGASPVDEPAVQQFDKARASHFSNPSQALFRFISASVGVRPSSPPCSDGMPLD